MANTFTMIGPGGVYPGQTRPQFPGFTSVNAPPQPAPPGPFVPIKPLPGAFGPSSTPL